jgi:hypothetical protein
MAAHTGTAIVCSPELAHDTSETLTGPVGTYIPGLIREGRNASGFLLVSLKFSREFPYLEEVDVDTEGDEIIWAALATGESIAYYPYPLGERRRAPSLNGDSAHASRLKRQYQMRQFLAHIPPSRWSRRQLHMLLVALQHLQSPTSAAEMLRLQTELNWARCRIAGMESSKFWTLRRIWFHLLRRLRHPRAAIE